MEGHSQIAHFFRRMYKAPWLDKAADRMQGAATEMREAMARSKDNKALKERANGRPNDKGRYPRPE